MSRVAKVALAIAIGGVTASTFVVAVFVAISSPSITIQPDPITWPPVAPPEKLCYITPQAARGDVGAQIPIQASIHLDSAGCMNKPAGQQTSEIKGYRRIRLEMKPIGFDGSVDSVGSDTLDLSSDQPTITWRWVATPRRTGVFEFFIVVDSVESDKDLHLQDISRKVVVTVDPSTGYVGTRVKQWTTESITTVKDNLVNIESIIATLGAILAATLFGPVRRRIKQVGSKLTSLLHGRPKAQATIKAVKTIEIQPDVDPSPNGDLHKDGMQATRLQSSTDELDQPAPCQICGVAFTRSPTDIGCYCDKYEPSCKF